MLIYNQSQLKPLKQALRKNSTDAERKIWNMVRNRQLLGLKFFMQYSVGNAILDFYCPESQLAIEVDGGQHNEQENIQTDVLRTKYLNSLNIQVLRFWNNDVLQNPEGTYDTIIKIVNELLPASSLEKRRSSLSFPKRGLG